MLSAFTARPIIELKQRDKSKIETILAHGDRLLVGLNTGSLRIYRVNSVASPDSKRPNGGSSGNGRGNDVPASPPNASSSPTTKAAPPSTNPSDLLREVEKFSTRAIEQLAIIKEANTLVSLSAYHVSLHDLHTYEPIETLSRTKNASCFAVTSNIVKDAATGIPEIISRLAVAVKRRLLLWSWHASELGDDVGEIMLPEAVRCVTWASATKIVCGMNAGYVLVDVETRSITEINGTGAAATGGQGSRFGAASMGYMGLGGYMPKPLAVKLAEGEMLLAKDINSLFIDIEGKPLEKRQIPWQSAPEGIGYNYPYILALQPPAKGSLEVRNPETLSLLQTLNLAGAAQLHFAPPTLSLVHAAKGFHISSERVVWKMDATDYDTQVAELIAQRLYDEAISVLGMLEDALLNDKTGTMREVKMLKAEELFKAKKYFDSLDLFNEDEVHAPPERVLRLYPPMIAGELSNEGKKAESREGTPEQEPQEPEPEPPQHEEEGKTNGEKISSAKSDMVEAASPQKAGGFSRYWPMAGGYTRKADSDTASISSSKKADKEKDDCDAASVIAPKPPASTEDGLLEGKDLMTAVRALNSYLAGTRARLQRVIDPATGQLKRQSSSTSQPSSAPDDPFTSLLTSQVDSDKHLEDELRATFTLVDTTLFRAYMFSQPKLAGSLFRIPNFCDPKVVNERLLESRRFNELVDFFYGKKLHREALTLLRKFGTADEDDRDEEGGEKKRKRKWWKPKILAQTDERDEEKDNGDHVYNGKDHDEATDLDVDIPVSEIPEQLRGPQRTIIYLQSLPPDLIDLIFEFADWVLHRNPDMGMGVFIADTENAETLPREQVVRYLAHIDEDLVDGVLEMRYLDYIIDELEDATPDFHNRLVELLVTKLKDTESEKDGDHQAAGDKRTDDWMKWMGRLVNFLRESKQYSLGRAFELIPREDPAFYEAQAVVLSNMEQHNQALAIYVFKMKDYAKAEEYCNRVHKLQSETSITAPSSPNTLHQRTRPPSSYAQPLSQATDQDDPEATPSIYHTLLSLYLTPPHPYEPNQEPALDLLSKHGSRLPATSTLSLIPDSLPVDNLESYFRGRIRAANSKLAETRILEGLRKTMLVNTQASLLLGDGLPGGQAGRNRRVVIEEERVCSVCHKRLGNSVVAVLPNNGVVHYACLGRSGKGAGLGRSVSGTRGRVAGAWGRSS
ncbi:uncharacterized protein BCR38DRAFT_489449 [Pseudomassariella vexata]|uniref:CNH domain-containing protein n=1 Tax=Pseudomassariella vexata TaxID=1141098 RepID=A0A1Y2DI98_9PEZI|nr:uncharacterized protein BCR38DRAFT_489449 [Pseudomassariella vexata]ORY58535.1 hypothetical protein BCR38DRAFT_489449 [Pseudomassariella vexata]